MNKYIRKLHRWLALPFVAMLLTVALTRNTSGGDATQRVQQILMLIMAITGVYLFVLPWWTKWRRQ